jgi:DNA-directed RNA polymerase subunit E'
MYKKAEVKDMVRVPPEEFSRDIEEAVISSIKKKYEGYISKEIGIVIDVIEVHEMGDGIIVPGDGAAYYQLRFSLLVYKPEVGEIVYCSIKDIADFGAFLDLGSIDGMIHISQTMDDFVSFSQEKVLSGRATKKVLKVGDLCRARIVAISYKDLSNPRIGLTMRQPGLGKTEWVEADLKEKPKKAVKKE